MNVRTALVGLTLVAVAGRAIAEEEKVGYKPVKKADVPATYAPSNPTEGPPEPFTYKNSAGVFKLSKGKADGAAKYTFMGKQNEDTLKFLDFGELADPTGIGVPAGQKVYVWMYEASDKAGNKWYLAFGLETLQGKGAPPNRYPMYWSYKDPTVAGNTMRRFLTDTGTTRE